MQVSQGSSVTNVVEDQRGSQGAWSGVFQGESPERAVRELTDHVRTCRHL